MFSINAFPDKRLFTQHKDTYQMLKLTQVQCMMMYLYNSSIDQRVVLSLIEKTLIL